jgi:hypothetical protein
MVRSLYPKFLKGQKNPFRVSETDRLSAGGSGQILLSMFPLVVAIGVAISVAVKI